MEKSDKNELLEEDMVNNSERPTIETSKEESVFDKGNERFDAISNAIQNGKEKAKNFFQKTGSRIGGFFKRTGKSLAIGILSAPEILDKGAEKYGNFVSNKVNNTIETIDKGTERYGDIVSEGVNKTIDAGKEGLDNLGKKIEKKFDQGLDFVDNKVINAQEFFDRKVFGAQEIVSEGVEFSKDIAFYLKNKTNEGLEKAGNSIARRYNSLMEFGSNSIKIAKEALQKKKTDYRNWKNEIRQARLAKDLEKSISGVSSDIESNRAEMQRRAELLQILNNRLNELKEQQNSLAFERPQSIAA